MNDPIIVFIGIVGVLFVLVVIGAWASTNRKDKK